MKFSEKVALVTGAGRGIGKSIAIALAEEGAMVAVNDVDPHSVEAVAKHLRRNEFRSIAIPGDVSYRDDVENMVNRVVEEFGRLDVLVNNAGVQTEVPFLELSEADWDRIIAVNLKGPFLCSQATARVMAKQGGGKIINVSSVHQEIPRPLIAHYAASKGGVAMLTKVMALELAPYKINVNAVAPGAIATAMNQRILDDPSALAVTKRRIPWKRIGKPDEVARLVLFLASTEADYITGSTFYIDGGLSLGTPSNRSPKSPAS